MQPKLVVDKDGGVRAVAKAKVKVTRQDILEGEIGDPNSCAIARAVSRVCSSDVNIAVTGSHIEVGSYVRAQEVHKALDKQLEKFVEAFDNLSDEPEERAEAIRKGKIRPFSFELELQRNVDVEVPDLCS